MSQLFSCNKLKLLIIVCIKCEGKKGSISYSYFTKVSFE